MNFSEFLSNNIVCLDGGMGTLLQARGLPSGELPERWNITHREDVIAIHKAYFDAGSNVISTNTFGANPLKFSHSELDEIIKAAFENAREARDRSSSDKQKFIALDIGPTGKLLAPLGDLDFEDAVSTFAEVVRLGVKHGAELIIIETMNDSYESKAALLAAKENSTLPCIVTNAYGSDGKLMTGASPEAMATLLCSMGADAIGANCSLGPRQLIPVAERLLAVSSVPVVMKPNAGLPSVVDGKTVFDVRPNEFAEDIEALCRMGVRVLGGCCGTTPEYIAALCERTWDIAPTPVEKKNITVVSSYTHAQSFGNSPVLIGERINPTGKKKFKEALRGEDMGIGYILSEGTSQQDRGAHILDVNVGLPDIDEKTMLCRAVCELQAVTDLPLQIDTADVSAMEAALRRYNGKAMINSVNGKRESMEAIFPLAKKYGGVIVALTLDESGIPDTADGRVEIAKRIIATAAEYGISKSDLIFDTLAMTVSADKNAASVTLEALERIKRELGCNTSLGVSNVSFGLPARDAVNSVFFTMALERGLSAAIMNPYSDEMMKAYYSWRALRGIDDNCAEYIAASSGFAASQSVTVAATVKAAEDKESSELGFAIAKGLREAAHNAALKLLESVAPLDIVNREIIPALDRVGKGFEQNTVYLPQLLMSAEAAKAAFEVIKAYTKANANSNEADGKKQPFVLATVKGDIHDIGKNIAKLLLENYGYEVVDLGRDVPPEAVLEAVKAYGARLVGLSALMTTTVPAMEETIKLLRREAPECKIVVGGAVLTEEYAARIGADKYASDAMEAVRYAENFTS